MNIKRGVDVHRAEIRCISLEQHTAGRQWNLIVDTEIVNSRRVITLKSLVQFVNHTETPFEVFAIDESNAMHNCGVVKANKKPLHIPINLLYTESGEFCIRPVGDL
jgi:hypothetical protein